MTKPAVNQVTVPLPTAPDGNSLWTWAQSLTALLQARLNLPIPKVPSGAMLLWPGTTSPDGYYICDGTERGRQRDAAIFRITGETFGAGDGLTTFNLPDNGSLSPPANTLWIIKA